MSRVRFTLLCAAILVGAVLAAEFLARLRADARHGDVRDVYQLFETIPGSDLLRPIPGLDAEFIGGRVQIDSRGFRSPELLDPRPEGGLLLAFLGGSTTFCSNVSGNEQTWPARTATRLAAAHPERRIVWLNAGATGYGVDHSIEALDLRLAGLEPDVIIIEHAPNDLARDSQVTARQAGLLAPEAEPGWLEDVSFLWMLVRKNQRYQAAQDAGRRPVGKLDVPAGEWSSGFAERLERLVRAAQERCRLVVLLTFSTLVRAEQPLEEQLGHVAQSFTFMPYLTPDTTLSAYAEYNRVIRDVAARTGALCLDVAQQIPGDTDHFADSVHLTDRGCDVLAQLVAEGLQRSPEFTGLLRD